MEYSVNELAQTIGAQTDTTATIDRQISEIIFDSRSLTRPEATAFFALRTSRADGHRFIPELYSRGVRVFVVDSPERPEGLDEAIFLSVDDTTEALGRLGKAHRERSVAEVTAITGSKGKTMVKEWLFAMMKGSRTTIRSPRSYNSSIGVPMSLLQIEEDTRLGLIEAGVSETGEMARLEQMIAPKMVILTDISEPHDEGFPSRQAKAIEKLRLASHAQTLIYPDDEPVIAQAIAQAKQEGILPEGLRLVAVAPASEAENEALTTDWQRRNLALCKAAARELGMSATRADAIGATLRPMHTRLNVSDGVNSCQIAVDDYPCDLHSLLPAIDFVRRRMVAGHTLTLVIGDLDHEDSAEAPAADYRRLAEVCGLYHIDRLVGIGREISRYKELFAANSRFFSDVDHALRELSTSDFNNELILLKGSRSEGLEPLAHMLEARTHETVLEVNMDALVQNFNFYRSHLKPTTGMVAMVKASGYGAGSLELAKTLQSQGAAYLAVAVLDEGIDLRKAGITMPIMVLNPKVLNYPLLFANRLEPEIFSFEMLAEIIAEAKKLGVKRYPVHIKLDTGMHRLGFVGDELPRLIHTLENQEEVEPASVFSHLATADCLDMDDYTRMQLTTYADWSGRLKQAFPEIKRHVLNTAGILRFPEFQYDMVRLGIGLYGIPILNNGMEDGLRPVSTLRSPIIALRTWEAGTTIGYGRRGRLKRRSIIATVPVGYADGIDRHMGRGRVKFLVNGVMCPTVGNICMDILMLDVTDANARLGDSVVVFGEENPATALSDALDTIPYEILTSVSPRVRRVYYKE